MTATEEAFDRRMEHARVLLYGRHWRWRPWNWTGYRRNGIPMRLVVNARLRVMRARVARGELP